MFGFYLPSVECFLVLTISIDIPGWSEAAGMYMRRQCLVQDKIQSPQPMLECESLGT